MPGDWVPQARELTKVDVPNLPVMDDASHLRSSYINRMAMVAQGRGPSFSFPHSGSSRQTIFDTLIAFVSAGLDFGWGLFLYDIA